MLSEAQQLPPPAEILQSFGLKPPEDKPPEDFTTLASLLFSGRSNGLEGQILVRCLNCLYLAQTQPNPDTFNQPFENGYTYGQRLDRLPIDKSWRPLILLQLEKLYRELLTPLRFERTNPFTAPPSTIGEAYALPETTGQILAQSDFFPMLVLLSGISAGAMDCQPLSPSQPDQFRLTLPKSTPELIPVSSVKAISDLEKAETQIITCLPQGFLDRVARIITAKRNTKLKVGPDLFTEWSLWQNRFAEQAREILNLPPDIQLPSSAKKRVFALADRFARLALIAEVVNREQPRLAPAMVTELMESPDPYLTYFYPQSLPDLLKRFQTKRREITSGRLDSQLARMGLNSSFLKTLFDSPTLAGIAEVDAPLPTKLLTLPDTTPESFISAFDTVNQLRDILAQAGIPVQTGLVTLDMIPFPVDGLLDLSILKLGDGGNGLLRLMTESQRRAFKDSPLSQVLMPRSVITDLISKLQTQMAAKTDIMLGQLVQDLIRSQRDAFCSVPGLISYPSFCRSLNRSLYRRLFQAELPVYSLDAQLNQLVTQAVINWDLFIPAMINLNLIDWDQTTNQSTGNFLRRLSPSSRFTRFQNYRLAIDRGQIWAVDNQNDNRTPLTQLIKSAATDPLPSIFLNRQITYWFEFCLLNYIPLDDGVYRNYPEYYRVYRTAQQLGWDQFLTIYPYYRTDKDYDPTGLQTSPYDLLYYYLLAFINL